MVPAGAVSGRVTLDAAVAPAEGAPTTSASAPVGAAIALSARASGGQAIHVFAHPLTLTIGYDPTGLSSAEQSKLVLASLATTGRNWTSLRTTVDATAHTLTTRVSHLTDVQERLLRAPAVRVAWPVTGGGRPAQATIAGGRSGACPSVPALLRQIAANARRGAANRFAPPYPAGCLWLPLQVSDPGLTPQFAGARVGVTATFAGARRVGLTVRLDGRGHAVAVLALPFRPRPTDRVRGHAGAAAMVMLEVVAADRHGTRQPPIRYGFVVVAPPRPTSLSLRLPTATRGL
jgi:hypothetical protein